MLSGAALAQVGAVLVDGKVAQLVQNQQPRPEVLFEFGFEAAFLLRGTPTTRPRTGFFLFFFSLFFIIINPFPLNCYF